MPSLTLTWLLEIELPTLPDAPPDIPNRGNYTDEEVADAVGKLVQGAIRRPYGILGERKTLDAFDDTMDAAAGVFILTPSAPFYVILLGARRLNDSTTTAITAAVNLLDSVTSTGRRVRPLTSLTSLGNARSALLALEAASSNRSSAFDDISTTPAFQRFDRHTDRFLTDAAGNIRVGEEIVQTPQHARKELGTLVSTVTEAFLDIQRRVRLLAIGIENYNSLNLPSLLAQGVINKARTVIDERIEQLDGLTPTARLEFLRDAALDILASKAVVKGFGSLTKSGEFVPIEGIGTTFADADHPATKAVVSSELLDSYVILQGADELTFELDGGPTTVTIPIQQSYLAKLEGTVREPFVITGGVNDQLEVDATAASDIAVTFTAGTRTAAQIVADINAEITIQPFVADTFIAPEKFIGTVTANNVVGFTVDFVKTGASWASLDVQVGDAVIVATTQLYLLITARAGTTISCTVSGPGTPVAGSNVLISVGVAGRFVRIRIKDGEEEESLDISRALLIETDVDDSAATTLGFLPGMEIACRRTRADEVALSINSNSAASVAGVPRVGAAAAFLGGLQTTGRTEPTNPALVVSSLYSAQGTVTSGGPSPAIFAVAGAAGAGVVVGNVVTVRSSPTTTNVGLFGVITLVNDTEVRATMTGGIPTPATSVGLEFGLNLSPDRDQVVRVLGPSPVSGDYRVLDSGNPTEATLDHPFPIFFGAGNGPVTFQMQLGAFRVDFQSLSTGVNSQLRITGSAALRFFNSSPAVGIGSTPYLLLENDPKVLEVGDRLEIYSGQYNEPEITFGIVGFEQGQRLIEVDAGIPSSFLTLDFSQTVVTPFARIRKIQRNNYDTFKIQLELWLDLGVNSDRYFSDLNRFINPLLVNENPTLSAVNTAKLHVQSLVQALQQLQLVLLSYQVDVVPQVDSLVDSFLSRGSDRAVDTLLEARFTEFFGYNSEEVSYLGNALERLRDVSRLDLPVRRTQRKAVIEQELTLSEFEDPDFEFDQSDTQDVDEPDIPGSFIEVPGSNF